MPTNGIAHDDDVKVGGRQRGRQLVQRLIRQRRDVLQLVAARQTRARSRTRCRRRRSRRRCRSRSRSSRAASSSVVSGWQGLWLPEYMTTNLPSRPCSCLKRARAPPRRTARRRRATRAAGWRFCRGSTPFSSMRFGHEAVERDDGRRAVEGCSCSIAGQDFWSSASPGRSQPAAMASSGLRSITQKTNRPPLSRANSAPSQEMSGGDVIAMTRSKRGSAARWSSAVRDVAAEIGGAPPPRLLPEAERRDAANLHAAPDLARGIPFARVVVRPPAADDGDVVSALDQRRRKIAGVLGRRRDVRVKRLVEEEDFHES